MHQASRPDNDRDNILTVSDVTVSFGNRPPILSNISFSLQAREILFVRGPSGAGKSRLLRAIAELDASHTGLVALRGTTAAEVGIPAWRQAICYVSDTPPPLSTSAEAAFQRALSFRSQRVAARTAASPPSLGSFRELVTKLGVDRDALQRPVHSLSAGERQRVALAWALALQPLVLLLDEPTSHLDAAATICFEQLLRERQLSVLWVTHDDRQIRRLGGRVLCIPSGALLSACDPEFGLGIAAV